VQVPVACSYEQDQRAADDGEYYKPKQKPKQKQSDYVNTSGSVSGMTGHCPASSVSVSDSWDVKK